MQFTSKIIAPKNWRRWLSLIVAFALLAHGAIPIGFMPDASRHAGKSFVLTICSGHAAGYSNDKTGHKAAIQGACSFSVNSIFSFASLESYFLALFAVFLELIVLSQFAFISMRRFGNAAPRAPPAFS